MVPEATGAGHSVRALSRHERIGYTGVHWCQGDLSAGTGLEAALDGIDVVVHCATQPTGSKDVTATKNLIDAATRAGVEHLIYISIAGIDRIPLPYYKAKLRAEEALSASSIGHGRGIASGMSRG